MERLPAVYALLSASENLAVDDALLEGLAAGERAYAPAAVATLLDRGNPSGLAGVISLFHELDEALQQQIVQRFETLFPVLRDVIRDKEIQTRLNAIELIRRSGSFRSSYLLALAVRDSASRVREAAAVALRDLAGLLLVRHSRTISEIDSCAESSVVRAREQSVVLAALGEECEFLVAAVAEAAQAFGMHLRNEVIEAAVRLASAMPPGFWRATSQKPGGFTHQVLQLLDSRDDPQMAHLAYSVLAVSALRQRAARSIATRRDKALLVEMIKKAWLLGDVHIRRGFARITSLDWLAHGVEPLLALPGELYPRAVRFISATGLPPARKVGLLEELLLLGPRPAQRAALWGLVEIATERSDQLLRTVVAWDDPELSPIALHELIDRRPRALPVAVAAGGGSEMAPRRGSGVRFHEYWENFDRLEQPARLSAGRRLTQNLAGLVRYLRGYMASHDSSERLRALAIANLLELARQLQPEVARLASDPDRFVRASAMVGLGQIGGQTCEGILRRSLHDEDKRVQANAIEALDRLSAADQAPQLHGKLNDSDNRVRANAVKALLKLKVPDAARALLHMIQDPNRMQRASAIWLIEKLDIVLLAVRMAGLAESDPDPYIRRAAARAAAALRHGDVATAGTGSTNKVRGT